MRFVLTPLALLLLASLGQADDETPPRDLEMTVVVRPDAGRLELHVKLRVPPEQASHVFDFLRPEHVGYVRDADSGKDLVYRVVPVDPRQGMSRLEVDGRVARLALEYSYDRAAFTGSSPNPASNDDLLLGEIRPQAVFASHLCYYPCARESAPRNATIRIQVPKGWTGVTAGKLASRRTLTDGDFLFEYSVDADSGRLPFPLAAFPYAVVEGRYADRVPLYVYAAADDVAYAREKLKAVREDVLPFLEDLMGPYPFDCLRIVEIFPSRGDVGLAARSLVMLTQKRWFAAPIDGDFSSAAGSVLIDELAHQWNYYKAPLPDIVAEGVSEYVDNLFLERRGGRALLDAKMTEYRATYRRVVAFLGTLQRYRERGQKPEQAAQELGVPIEEVKALWPYAERGEVPITDPAVVPSLYFVKGALALHALRHELGDKTFFLGFRRMFQGAQAASLTLADFRAAFQVASGRDLTAFFHRWYQETGLPE